MLRRVSSHTKDADFNAQRFAKEWEAITYDTEVRTNPPTNQVYVRVQPYLSTLADSGVARQVVITPHPLNVETEMTLAEFADSQASRGMTRGKRSRSEWTSPQLADERPRCRHPHTDAGR